MMTIAFWALLIFVSGCEESTSDSPKAPKSYLVVKKDPVVSDDGRYVFEVTSFVSADQIIYEEGDVPKDKLQALWDSAVVRWGFRKKDSPDRIYWVQKNRAYTKDDGNQYSIEVEEKDKAKFAPQELPAVLLQVPESNLEIYVKVSVENLDVTGAYDLPEDFKTKIMQLTELSGRVFNFSSLSSGSGRSKIVAGAGIHYIHRDTGKIFHTFSDVGGDYRISVQYYGVFFRVVLTHNMAPLVSSYTLDYVKGRTVVLREDLGVNELAAGVTVAESQLYDISSGVLGTPPAGGTPVSGSTVDSRNTKMIPGAFLLFYDRSGQRIYFLKSGADGRFSFSLPAVSANPATTGSSPGDSNSFFSFIPGAYGYTSINGYIVLSGQNTPSAVLGVVGFEPKIGIQISDMDSDGLLAHRDLNDKNWDYDGDGIPDGADVDIDGDGTKDNGKDSDGDGINNISDAGAGDPDADRDGIKDAKDTIDNRKDQDKDGLPDDIDPNDGNPDTDGDGIPDGADVDVNNDGIKDNGKDTDGDGINDRADMDADGDGSPDAGKPDADRDGLSDVLDPVNNNADADKDGLPDDVDPNDHNWDTDGDTIPDGADADVNGDGTNDNGSDTDRDGINDRSDVDVDGNGSPDTGKTDSDTDGIRNSTDTIDNNMDADRDGLPDGIDPNNNNPDVDGDGIPDGSDVDVNGDGTNDNGIDTDGDGINDANDGTDRSSDKDKDGLPDTSDPNDNNRDTDGDGIPDGVDVDVNGDGTADNGTDTDGDGIRDRADANSNPGKADSDGDGIIDLYDLADNRQDADKDGLPDALDTNSKNWDTDGDGIPDGADVDADGNKVPENGTDSDRDGINDHSDSNSHPAKGDRDSDGIIDDVDTIDNRQDADTDGLPDDIDPNDKNWDTDGDAIPDGADVDVNGDGTNDNGIDTDGDGINDRVDTDANPGKSDSDGDGIIDEFDTIDNRLDEDNDGLPDAIDPNDSNIDTDGDGIKDGDDVDVNGDRIPDNGRDADNDGIRDGLSGSRKPRLSWDTVATTNTRDANGGKFDFGGSPVTVNLRIVAEAFGDSSFTYKWFRGTTVAGAILDSSQTGASADFRLNSPGLNVIVVKVRNSGGESVLSKTYDLNKPPYGLRITSPSAGRSVNLNAGAAVPLSATATEDDAGQTLSYSWLIAPGRAVTAASAFSALIVGADSTYVFTQTAGDYTLKARASDTDGGSTEGTVSVTLTGDASGLNSGTRPGIAAGSGSTRAAPQNNPLSGDGSAISSAAVTVNNVVRENGGVGIRSVSWQVDGVTQTGTTAFTSGRSAYGETFTIRNPARPHTITMVAVNNLGEETHRSQTYYLNQAPEFDESVTAVTVQSYDIPTAQSLSVKAADANGGTLTYTASVASGFNVPNTGTYRDLGPGLKNPAGVTGVLPLNFDIGLRVGSYTLRIVVSDQHGGARDVLLRNIRLTGARALPTPVLRTGIVTATSVALSWNSVANADSYTLSRTGSSATITKGGSETGHTFTGLAAGSLYTFSVTANGTSGYSDSDAGTAQVRTSGQKIAVTTPVLRTGAVTATSVTLSWNSVANAGSYTLSRSGSNVTVTKGGSETGHTFTGLAAGSLYTFSVTAHGTSGYSDSDAGTAQVRTSGQKIALTTPVLRTGTVTATSVTLSWNSVANAGSYTLSRSGSNVTVTKGSSETGHTFTGLTAGSRYTFTITADGTGLYSDSDAGTAQATTSAQRIVLPTPVLRTGAVTATSVTLSWNSVANAGSYTLSRSGSNVTVTKGSSGTSHTFTGLAAGSRYTFTITAHGTGLYSDSEAGTAQATTSAQRIALPTPVLRIGTVTATSVTLSWNSVANAVSYTLSRSGSNVTVTKGSSETGHTFTGLTAGSRYTFTITAHGTGLYSDSDAGTAQVTTSAQKIALPTPVLRTGTVTATSVTLSWNSVANAGSYTLSRSGSNVTVTKGSSGTSHTFTGLAAGSLYTFTITAHGTGLYSDSEAGTAQARTSGQKIALTTPVLRTGIVTATSVTLSWNSVANAAGYTLSRTGSSATVTKGGSDTGHTFTGLAAGSLYTFSVTANGTSGYSDSDAGTAQVRTSGQKIAVTTPVLRTGTVTATSVTLSWNSVANAGSYTLSRSGSNVTVTKGGSETSHTFTGLTAGSRYTFTIKAHGTGLYSDSDAGTAQATTSAQKIALPTPVLRTGTVTATSVTLSWNSVANADSYILSRSGSNVTVTKGGSETSHTFTGLTAGSRYTFTIKAQGRGLYSDSDAGTAQATTSAQKIALPTPVLRTGTVTATSVTLSWNSVANAGSYTLSRSGSNVTVTKGSSATSHTFTGLTAGTGYTFTVTARGTGSYSDSRAGTRQVSTSTQDLVAPVLRVGTVTTTSVTLSWNSVANALSYTLSRSGSSVPVIKGSSATGHTFTGLTANTLYTFSVAALSSGSYSNSAPGLAEVRTLRQKLATPVLRTGTVTKTSVTLHWNSVTNAADYILSRSGSNVNIMKGSTDTSHTFTGLVFGSPYTFTVTARGTGSYTNSDSSSKQVSTSKQELAAPVLRAETVTLTSVTLRWNSVANAGSYILFLAGSEVTVTKGSEDTEHTFAGLTGDRFYTFFITARGLGAYADSKVGTVQASTFRRKLGTPVLRTGAVTATSVTVHWESVANAGSYRLSRSDPNAAIASKSGSDTSHTFTNLRINTLYTFTLTARGTGLYSDSDAGTIQAKTSRQKLATPVLRTGTVTDTSVTVQWNSVANADSYSLSRSGSNVNITKGRSSTSHTFTGLTANSLYTFTLIARGTGAYSDSDGGTRQVRTLRQKLTTPVLRTGTVTKTSVTLNWNSLANAAGYTLSRTGSNVNIMKGSSSTSHTFTGLTANSLYTFTLIARGTGAYSDSDGGTVEVRTLRQKLAVPVLRTGTVTDTSVTVHWNSVANAGSYRVSRMDSSLPPVLISGEGPSYSVPQTGSSVTVTKGSSSTSHTFEGLAADSLYIFTVIAGGTSTYADSDGGTVEVRTLKFKYTIRFNATGGTAIADQMVIPGAKLPVPDSEPVKANQYFGGWYTTSDRALFSGKTKYDFDKPVTGPMTLYARWYTEQPADKAALLRLLEGKGTGDLSYIDVRKVTNMDDLFWHKADFNGDISTWDVSKVTSMNFMFFGAHKFNQDIGDWDVSHVKSMWGMFSNARNFNQDIGDWDVSGVVNMVGMFYRATKFNEYIGRWDVSNVGSMRDMFLYAEAFNRDISGWDTAKVAYMDGMFKGARSFSQSLSGWNVGAVTDSNNFALDSRLLHYQLPDAWKSRFSSATVAFVTNGGQYMGPVDVFNRAALPSWAVSVRAPNAGVSYYFGGWYTTAEPHTAATKYNVGQPVTGDLILYARWYTEQPADKDALRALVIRLGNTDLNHIDVRGITDMSGLFSGLTGFNADISRWDVSRVVNMVGMFQDAKSFNKPIGGWDVSGVTNMGNMFHNAWKFNQPIQDWNLNGVWNTEYMFSQARAFNQPLNNWDVSTVGEMKYMFSGAWEFNQPLNNWNVANVYSMYAMFQSARSFVQNISGWNVDRVASGYYDKVFYHCPIPASHKPPKFGGTGPAPAPAPNQGNKWAFPSFG
ncbi:BspA family leucine-rich repeat surface protein [Candidatus Haliotispira prima]|uniref:BspA family leucine-rich repeat surface protein n=1 Tax=Candidatus Haliotispira prima TaxID=3034016 RepID=A0ABY8MKR6_9SPIO|nr:BspA family leucine-rich repeat surface protein [Candidatus Haliotispira prima]